MLFGTKRRSDDESLDLSELERLLDRQSPIQPLDEVISAIKYSRSDLNMSEMAVGLDANVLLRLGTHRRGPDIIDYFNAAHKAPLILPGQVIQEFWNNLHVFETVASSIRKKFDELHADLKDLDPAFETYVEKLKAVLDDFSKEHGHVYAEGPIRKTTTLLETLQQKAIVPYAPRARFANIAGHRKRTKTPPSFKDEGDGDFYVWVDFLRGLQVARRRGMNFKCAVLVTQDQKKDWSRAGVAHPILAAEVTALAAVPFETWSMDDLANKISQT